MMGGRVAVAASARLADDAAMRPIQLRARVVAGVLALLLPRLASAGVSAVAWAAPAPTGPVRAELEIDAAALGDDGEVVASRIRVRAEALLRAREVLPARSAADPRLRLEVSPLGGDDPGYSCKWAILRAGEPVDGATGASVCRLCTEAELLDHVDAALARGISQLPRTEDVPAKPSAAAAGSTPASVERRPRVADAPPPTRQPLGTLGKVGIAGLAIGVGALVPGIVLVALPDRVGVGDNELNKQKISTRVPGIAMIAGGGAAIIAGIVTLAIDRRRAHAHAQVRLTPAGVRRGAGVSIEGRF